MSTLVSNVSVWRWSASSAVGEGDVRADAWLLIDSDGVILRVGESGEPCPSDAEHRIDGGGSLVLPGLQDAHIHVMGTGESATFLDLKNCQSIEELQQRLALHVSSDAKEGAEAAAAVGTTTWIQGVNWDQTDLGRTPTRHDLDAALKGTTAESCPVFLWRACWHIGVANTAALLLAGLDPTQCNNQSDSACAGLRDLVTDGGSMEVDEEGRLTGILKERATERVTAIMSHKTSRQMEAYIAAGLKRCLEHGLTSVQTNDEGALASYLALQQRDELPIRVFLTPTYDDMHKLSTLQPSRPDCFKQSPPLRGAVAETSSVFRNAATSSFSSSESKLFVERIKIFSDGSLGAGTAAIRSIGAKEPASGADYSGILIHQQDLLSAMMSEARARDFRLEVHAIGDKAALSVLDAMTSSGTTPAERPVLTHCQVLGPDLLPRMTAMGVVGNVQPSFVPTDMRWVMDRLTPGQQRYSYCWRSMLEAGIVVSGGSDAPIETPNPFEGLYDAIYRESRASPARLRAAAIASDLGGDVDEAETSSGKEPQAAIAEADVFLPKECLTFAQALYTYTINAAIAGGVETQLGRIEAGYVADLVLVDPLVASDPRRLLTCQPRLVLVGGRVAYTNTGAGSGAGDANDVRARVCPCCRPSFGLFGGGRGGAGGGSSASGWKDAAWEEAMLGDGVSVGISTSEDFCLLVGTGARRGGSGRGRGRGGVRKGGGPRLK